MRQPVIYKNSSAKLTHDPGNHAAHCTQKRGFSSRTPACEISKFTRLKFQVDVFQYIRQFASVAHVHTFHNNPAAPGQRCAAQMRLRCKRALLRVVDDARNDCLGERNKVADVGYRRVPLKTAHQQRLRERHKLPPHDLNAAQHAQHPLPGGFDPCQTPVHFGDGSCRQPGKPNQHLPDQPQANYQAAFKSRLIDREQRPVPPARTWRREDCVVENQHKSGEGCARSQHPVAVLVRKE